MPTLALLLAADGTVLESGPAAEGFPGDDGLAGGRLQDRVLPEDRARVESWLDAPTQELGPTTLRFATTDAGILAVDARGATLALPGHEGPRRVCLLSWGESPAPGDEEIRQLQRLGALGQLAGGLAHDLNNFLTAILGYASLALMKTEAEDPRERMLAPLKECTERAAQLAHRMLSFSRSSTGEHRALSARELVENALSMVRPALPRGIELRTELPARELWARGDAVQLEQVLVNLCINARDALAGEGLLSLRLLRHFVDAEEAARHPGTGVGQHVAIEVADDGPGIPAEILPRIFDPFFTTKAPGSGTGLGLANVAAILAEHRGHVEVESQPGSGARFRIVLPEAAAPVSVDEGADAKGGGLISGRGTVLVVAGDDAIRSLVEMILGQVGYDVLTAVHGGEALMIYGMHREEVRLVVLDDGLATVEGRDCGAMLRDMNEDLALLRLGRPPADEGDAVEQLPKPFDAPALSAAVSAAIGR